VIILIIDPDGQVLGRLIEETETIEATAEPLKALLAGYEKEGTPWMIGGSDDEVCWDGFIPVFPGDPRYPDALARGLLSAGYRFKEGLLEEPSPLSSPTTPQDFP